MELQRLGQNLKVSPSASKYELFIMQTVSFKRYLIVQRRMFAFCIYSERIWVLELSDAAHSLLIKGVRMSLIVYIPRD